MMDRIEVMNPDGDYIVLDEEAIEYLLYENEELRGKIKALDSNITNYKLIHETWKKEKQKLQNALCVLINICEDNTKLDLSNYKKIIEDMEDEE